MLDDIMNECARDGEQVLKVLQSIEPEVADLKRRFKDLGFLKGNSLGVIPDYKVSPEHYYIDIGMNTYRVGKYLKGKSLVMDRYSNYYRQTRESNILVSPELLETFVKNKVKASLNTDQMRILAQWQRSYEKNVRDIGLNNDAGPT